MTIPATKPKSHENETDQRQALAAAVRALAELPEQRPLFVPALSDWPSSLLEQLALPGEERQADWRGQADMAALCMKHHDAALHQGLAPTQGRVLFDRLEEARCAALGASLFPGVARNLSVLLEGRCQRHGREQAKGPMDAPLEESLPLQVYETLYGHALPPAAHRSAQLWQSFVDERAPIFCRNWRD